MPKPTRRTRANKRRKQAAVAERVVTYRPGKPGKTDWERLDHMTDEEIDQQIKADPDVAPEFDKSWMADAELVVPETKEAVSLRLDPDVLARFKAPGPRTAPASAGFTEGPQRRVKKASTRHHARLATREDRPT